LGLRTSTRGSELDEIDASLDAFAHSLDGFVRAVDLAPVGL
jgi:hypothetical protein